VNLYGTFMMCREAIPHLLATKATSSTRRRPPRCRAAVGGAYSASKGAVLAMTRTIAVEYGRRRAARQLRLPGDIATPDVEVAANAQGRRFQLDGTLQRA